MINLHGLTIPSAWTVFVYGGFLFVKGSRGKFTRARYKARLGEVS